jgi:hypothetical protein
LEARGSWKYFHNEELSNIYPSPNIIMVNKLLRWLKEVGRMDDKKNVYKGFARNSKRKRLFEVIGHRYSNGS